jgi:hypothetical protein
MNSKLSKLFIRQQLDESTDAANVASNFIFNRYTRNFVKELSYFCKLSESTTTGSDSKKDVMLPLVLLFLYSYGDAKLCLCRIAHCSSSG